MESEETEEERPRDGASRGDTQKFKVWGGMERGEAKEKSTKEGRR